VSLWLLFRRRSRFLENTPTLGRHFLDLIFFLLSPFVSAFAGLILSQHILQFNHACRRVFFAFYLTEMLAAELSDRKVHGSGALAALMDTSSSRSGRDGSVGSRSSENDVATTSHSHSGVPPPGTPPVDIAAGPAQQSVLRFGSSGSRLSFLSCFSSSSKKTTALLGEDEEFAPQQQATCEVGIRPSFYWVDSPSSEEQRLEVEATMRFVKADCQDEACVLQNFARVPGLMFIGVFDGHGPNGRAAAKFASERLPAALAAQMSTQRGRSERKRLKAMREACRIVDAGMRDVKQAGFDSSLSGTTACFALVEGSRVLLANVGDSRCVLARQTADGEGVEGVPLTKDAKPELPDETRRIVASGGVVRQLLDESGRRCGAFRVFRRGDDVLPGLAMSRSLGDSYAHSVGVTWEPVLASHSLTSRDHFLLVGTDGLWDVMDNAAAVDFVERYRHRRDSGVSCAEALTLEAQERWKAAHDEALVDDISVAILHVAPLPPPERQASLPLRIARAASSNDEANALWSSWQQQKTAEEDPSNHSPRRFFDHLYAEEVGGEVVVSAPAALRSGSGSLVAVVAAEEKERSPQRSPARVSDLLEEPGILGLDAGGLASPPAPTSPDLVPCFPRPTLLAADQYDALVSSSAAATATIRTRAAAINMPSAVPRVSSGNLPIPTTDSSLAAASAPNHHQRRGGGGDVDVEVLRPVRKAYPSTNTLASVPSWDGTFYHQSFKSEMTSPHGHHPPASGGGYGTPRGSEDSNDSSSLSRRDPTYQHHHPHRGEMRHEGKVHRGIPRSFSSTGLASHGRLSTDTDSSSRGTSTSGFGAGA